MSYIKEFISLVSNEKFEQAHEVLEDYWLEFKKSGQKEKALFYKGLINGATSIALIRRNRSQRAKDITWNAFLKYETFIEKMDQSNYGLYNEAINIIKTKREKFYKNQQV